MKKITSIVVLALIGCNSAFSFKSDIFSYDTNLGNPGYLHVAIQGNGWRAEDIKEEHSPFHQGLFNNLEVMKGFADGQVRKPEDTAKRITTAWIPRFAKGQPHGGLSLFDDQNQLIGCIVGGGGERAGASEIAATLSQEAQWKKLASDLTEKTVTIWAPEVRRIGLGIDLTEQEASIKKAFCCFMEKPLEWLDATASPSNVASWYPMVQNGFQPAVWKRAERIIDLTTGPFEGAGDSDLAVQYQEMEKYILEKSFTGEDPIPAGQRLCLVDHRGKEWTLSKHERWNRLKFHFEYQVTLK